MESIVNVSRIGIDGDLVPVALITNKFGGSIARILQTRGLGMLK